MALTVSDGADARLGGGRSIGAQRASIAPQRPATAPNAASQPVMPSQPGAALPAKPAVAPAVAPSGMSRWLGPIAGIAAGLGLAALLSHFGLPEGFGSFLLIALLVIAAIVVVRMLLSRRTPAATTPMRPMEYAGTSNVGSAPGAYGNQSLPEWGGTPKTEPVLAPAAAGVASSLAKPLPPDFDVDGFVTQAKLQFNRLQAAYDACDRGTLSDVTTPEMFAEVGRDLSTRHEHRPTEIVTLDAEVLEVTTEDESHWASVRYTGLLREDGEPLPKPIDEVWNLTKPVNGKSGWLLAGIQQVA
jgi:predicted lipid-binding transport protein (Tim44 family)